MASRRARIQEFYSLPREQRGVYMAKAAAAYDQFSFAGPALVDAAVVRTDLNGYSDWSRDKPIDQRVSLLDDFFSYLVPKLRAHCGVFFRDEGDCLVSLFTGYFGEKPTLDGIEDFCMVATRRLYGIPQLSAKTTVARGTVAIFQKAHEVETEDWSAEGDAFVRAARLEQAVPSKREITFFGEDYERDFADTNIAQPGLVTPQWTVNREPLQVPGLALAGGWCNVVILRPKET